MTTPVLMHWTETFNDCGPNPAGFLCSLSPEARKALAAIAYMATYPDGSTLFSEQETPRGVFVLLRGRVKVTMTSAEGKTLILRIARPGDVLGLSAVINGQPHQATAETLENCQFCFVKRESFLGFLRAYPEASMQAAKQMGSAYRMACDQVRALGLLHSAPRKLAGFLLDWAASSQPAKPGISAKLTLTHEEIGQMIGASRETVTRTLADFKHQRLAMLKGSTLVIQNKPVLQQFAEV